MQDKGVGHVHGSMRDHAQRRAHDCLGPEIAGEEERGVLRAGVEGGDQVEVCRLVHQGAQFRSPGTAEPGQGNCGA